MAVNYALEPGSPHWPVGGVVTWYYAGTSSTEFSKQAAAGYSTPDLFPAELQAAFSRWSQIANIHFQQTTNSAAANITISWSDVDGSFGTVARTGYSYTGSGLFISAQIIFDDLELYNPASGAELLSNGVTFESVALHEIGHALGLGHYDSAPAIMNSFVHASVTDLTQSDIDGILAIYGPSITGPSVAATDLSVATIQNDYFAITRTPLSLAEAMTIASSINAGLQTETQYISTLLSQVANTTIPAVAVEASMFGAVGTSFEVTSLVTQFLPGQVANAMLYGHNPQIYASEALGLALAFGNEFASHFGPSTSTMPNTTSGDAAFASAAASAIFGMAANANTPGAIQTFVNNWKALFTANGVVGIANATADQVDLAARGAAWGDAVGIALANNLGPLPGQVTNFLENAAQGTAIYSASLSSQPIAAPFHGSTAASTASDVQLIGIGVELYHDHAGII